MTFSQKEEAFWVRFQELVRNSFGAGPYEFFVGTAELIEITPETVKIQLESSMYREFWEKQAKFVRLVAFEIYKKELTYTLYIGSEGYLVSYKKDNRAELLARSQRALEEISSDFKNDLDDKCKFGNFVRYDGNRKTFDAAAATANDLRGVYNPLLIYSKVGMGKTHLLHAIGHHILLKKPDAHVKYVSSEDFIRDCIENTRQNSLEEFSNDYKMLDALLLDDIHFMANRADVIDVFFQIFNALYNKGAQIVIASDRLPREIEGFEEQAKSRFNWEMMTDVTDIAAPTVSDRLEILRFKAEQIALNVSQETLESLAEQVESNIGELEDILADLKFYAECHAVDEVDSTIAQKVLGSLLGNVRIGTVAALENFSGASEEAEEAEIVETPEEVETTETAEVSEEVEISEEPEIAERLEEVETTETAEVSEEVDLSEEPEIAETLEVAETVEIAEVPEKVEVVEVSEEPEVTEAPEEVEAVAITEVSEVSEEPEVIEKAEEVEAVEIAEVPEVAEENEVADPTAEQDFENFKRILEYFVHILRANNKENSEQFVAGEKKTGHGGKGQKIRESYEKFRYFSNGHTMDVSIQGGFQLFNKPNYIEWSSNGGPNIRAIWNDAQTDVISLQEFDGKAFVGNQYTVDELGLNDNDQPNDKIIEFYKAYTLFLEENLAGAKEIVVDTKIKALATKLADRKNLILRGAPGTGKTYCAKQIAAELISEGATDKLEELSDKQKAQVEFVQFHPNYTYADFVEGLRPVTSENGQSGFKFKTGIFKEFCERARGKYVLSDALEADEQEEATHKKIVKSYWRDEATTEELKKAFGKDTNHPVENVVAYIKEELLSSEKTAFDWKKTKDKKFVFIIDEINRGEISKIFGELFFSIDPDYRGKTGAVALQHQNLHVPDEKFYIPENVYIIGTMNDIDCSVEPLDFAMRRRFTFVEITAEESQNWLFGKEATRAKDSMTRLNDAIISAGLLSKDYQIGASYFKNLAEGTVTKEELWTDELHPLLKEYLRGDCDVEAKLARLKVAYDNEKLSDDAVTV
ncbi:hypothetical protein Hs30E_09980 [Lactococcus hodotermopsidis]|uniref:Chromosomal replication initiator protein DnaA n=1 Tax=Pseudolactococcus hodotermopsidis TaxID=2709157 RepID=A0A6A0BF28_9LACT|nr:DnaA/Hda family protein [Lactococcus hodotermopsidis]GFH42447.1 hypothetical protein Hs30E_09980 [Lactococcus hodotermopsidis]